jgi:hypothetical protein
VTKSKYLFCYVTLRNANYDPQIQCNPQKLLCGYQYIDSKVYMEWQKTQNSQHNIEEEQNWRTYTL